MCDFLGCLTHKKAFGGRALARPTGELTALLRPRSGISEAGHGKEGRRWKDKIKGWECGKGKPGNGRGN